MPRRRGACRSPQRRGGWQQGRRRQRSAEALPQSNEPEPGSDPELRLFFISLEPAIRIQPPSCVRRLVGQTRLKRSCVSPRFSRVEEVLESLGTNRCLFQVGRFLKRIQGSVERPANRLCARGSLSPHKPP